MSLQYAGMCGVEILHIFRLKIETGVGLEPEPQ